MRNLGSNYKQKRPSLLMAFLVNMAEELRFKLGTQRFKLYKYKKPLIA